MYLPEGGRQPNIMNTRRWWMRCDFSSAKSGTFSIGFRFCTMGTFLKETFRQRRHAPFHRPRLFRSAESIKYVERFECGFCLHRLTREMFCPVSIEIWRFVVCRTLKSLSLLRQTYGDESLSSQFSRLSPMIEGDWENFPPSAPISCPSAFPRCVSMQR